MKASAFVAILLLLLLLFSPFVPQYHGIRLVKRLSFGEEEASVEAPNLNSDEGEADRDDDHGGGHYSYEHTQFEGKNRKLFPATSSSSSLHTSSMAELKHYHDIIDIAEMDYSPAKRKPPIHN